MPKRPLFLNLPWSERHKGATLFAYSFQFAVSQCVKILSLSLVARASSTVGKLGHKYEKKDV
ncbi:hypothetical protein N0V86_008586 [Didymella sp. IMI 355093]|nr:hypothetical protein N0V86_008586 [Didymella sp. IMI 355093]